MTTLPNKVYHILLVEDNANHITLMEKALRENDVNFFLSVYQDGNVVVELLKLGQLRFPDLILLELNATKVNSRELLPLLKNIPELRRIPVIVLTDSTQENDIHFSYSERANCYISKPTSYDGFFEMIKKIKHFWLSHVILPSEINNLL